MKDRKKGFLYSAVAALLCIVFSFVVISPAFAVELTEEQQATLDESIQRMKEKQEVVDNTQSTLYQIEEEIGEINDVIDGLDARMAETKAELEVLEEQYQVMLAELEERLRVNYMYGEFGYLEMIFSIKDKGFADMLTWIDKIWSLMKSDRDRANAIKETEESIKDGIASLEKDKADAEILKERQGLLLRNAEALLALQKLQYEAEKADADAIAQSLGLQDINEYMSGFEWPFDPGVDSSFIISSYFGGRSSPGGFGSSDHTGIDITPGAGLPIGAIASGVVVKSEYYGGYGNCVVIQHKNSQGQIFHSLYGHMASTPLVSVGQTVYQGQVIGYVGSTGASTGAHLHLEIWENTTPVDPLNYFERYSDRFSYNP